MTGVGTHGPIGTCWCSDFFGPLRPCWVALLLSGRVGREFRLWLCAPRSRHHHHRRRHHHYRRCRHDHHHRHTCRRHCHCRHNHLLIWSLHRCKCLCHVSGLLWLELAHPPFCRLPLVPLECLLGALGCLLDPFWMLLGTFWMPCAPSWALLGASWDLLQPSGSVLDGLGASRCDLRGS